MERIKSGHINLVCKDDNFVYTRLRNREFTHDPLDQRFNSTIKFLQTFNNTISPTIVDADPKRKRIKTTLAEGENLFLLLRELDNENKYIYSKQAYFQLGKNLHIIHTNTYDESIPAQDFAILYKNQIYRDLYQFIELNSILPDNLKINANKLIDIVCNPIFNEVDNQFIKYTSLPWIHGDYWSWNAVAKIKDNLLKITAIVDPEFSRPGLPMEDLAQMWMWELSTLPKDIVNSFHAGYGDFSTENLNEYIIINCLNFLRPLNLSHLSEELKTKNPYDGFYHLHLQILKDAIAHF